MKQNLISLLFAAVFASALSPLFADDARPDLTGRVSGDASAITNATVFIYTAGPKVGTASLCPSCYPDCRKQAQTDPKGQFKIEALDPKLLFRLLVVAPGYEAQFVPRIDPALSPIEVALQKADSKGGRLKSRAGGIVIGPEGEPLMGAVLNVEGLERGSSTRWGGNDQDADPVAVTDDQGRFFLHCVEGVTAIHAVAECRGVAKRWVRLSLGHDHLVRMDDGVLVSGRILRKGTPLNGVVVGLITTEREAGKCLHDFEASTDKDGRFALECVTPNATYYFYSKMESLLETGALPVKTITAGASGTILKLGDIEVQPACRVAGRVVLSDHKPIPAQTRLVLGREQAWDYTEAILAPDGSFDFQGVPNESISLSVRIRGYKFSKRNPSLDWANGSIVGRVEHDIAGLNLLMEPGQWQFRSGNDDDAPPEADRQPGEKPLRGIVADKL
jgi:hypothetical protein